jgi:AGCS family alanine or glycine:cation symporter
MFENLTEHLELLENFLWSYFGVPIVLLLGLYLTIRSNFFQIRHLPTVFRTFVGFLRFKSAGIGVHPLKAFFAAVGGCVGIGNIVGICTAVQLGGPGALLWIWVTATLGMIIKYSEVYLGLRHRVQNKQGGYSGGPMYFLAKAFNNRWIAPLVCILLCVYGVEVYQFSVVTASISTNFGVNSYLVIAVLLMLVIFAGSGGVQRVGSISSASLPVFVIIYVGMGLWVLLNHLTALPGIFALVFSSAFTGHAALGGFAGAGLMYAMSHGIRRSCYSGDIGVGYASVIHSESSVQVPEKQASLAIFDIFLDTFIVCTTSIFIILATDVWHQPIEAGLMVQTALSNHFPFMNIFMPIFIFMLGYNTINAYFCVGLKCASHLSQKWGRTLYYLYAVAALLLFSFMGTNQAQMVMAIAGVSLLIINGIGIYKLRHEISFNLPSEAAEAALTTTPSPTLEQV